MELIFISVVLAMAIMKSLEMIGPRWRAALGGAALAFILAAGILRATDASPRVAIPQSGQSGPVAETAGR